MRWHWTKEKAYWKFKLKYGFTHQMKEWWVEYGPLFLAFKVIKKQTK